jgi:hypothetical protein
LKGERGGKAKKVKNKGKHNKTKQKAKLKK